MNLKDLRDAGAMVSVGFEDAVKKTVKWEGKEFDVCIKPTMSYADYEFIYTGKGDDDSFAARRIHRFVVLDKGERIPYADAKLLKPSLVTVLAAAINEVQKQLDSDDKKKH